MAKINKGIFKDWQNGESIEARAYVREREILAAAITDNHYRTVDADGKIDQYQNMVDEIGRTDFFYDTDGRLYQEVTPHNTIYYSYDSEGRIETEEHVRIDKTILVTYNYDQEGKLSSINREITSG